MSSGGGVGVNSGGDAGGASALTGHVAAAIGMVSWVIGGGTLGGGT